MPNRPAAASPAAGARVWALLGHRTGDNNQLLALAETLGIPFETRSLRYNLLRALEGDFLGPSLISLKPSARRHLTAPWPDLLIASGRRSVPVARWVRRASGGTTRLVLIGHPRVDPRDFDLVLTTHQYPVPRHDNVILLPLAMGRDMAGASPTADEQRLLAALPRPHLLFAIGGSTKYHDLLPEEMADAARRIAERAAAGGGTAIAIGSPRTGQSVLDAVGDALASGPHMLVRGPNPRFRILMDDADEIFVSADSMSMLSEAILSGKPVGLVPIALNATGRKWLGDGDRPGKGRGRRRDMRRVWDNLTAQGLIGTIAQPVASTAANPVIDAAAAVRRLLDRPDR